MEAVVALITFAAAFLTTIVLTSYWIRAARKAGLVGKDMNKYSKQEVPEAGGVAVVLGFSFALLVFIFFETFFLKSSSNIIRVFAILSSLLIASFLGFIDDILGWKIGLKQWQKPILTIPAAIPLMVINAGMSTMVLPIIGKVDLGVLYPLLVIPIGIIGAANGFNFVAGHNSLEAGMGIIILGTLGFFSLGQSPWLSIICFAAVAALLGFLVYNKYPAKIFPGDSLTYPIGTLVAVVAILGNLEKVAIILFIPYIIEFLLKLRSRFRAESFGVPDKGDRLSPMYDRIYSLPHVAMIVYRKLFRRKPKEYDVVLLLMLFELVFVALALISV